MRDFEFWYDRISEPYRGMLALTLIFPLTILFSLAVHLGSLGFSILTALYFIFLLSLKPKALSKLLGKWLFRYIFYGSILFTVVGFIIILI